jgi:hypothetical protein
LTPWNSVNWSCYYFVDLNDFVYEFKFKYKHPSTRK